jgi:hypothetical protein
VGLPFNLLEDLQTLFQTRASKAGYTRTVGLVEAGLKDNRHIRSGTDCNEFIGNGKTGVGTFNNARAGYDE